MENKEEEKTDTVNERVKGHGHVSYNGQGLQSRSVTWRHKVTLLFQKKSR